MVRIKDIFFPQAEVYIPRPNSQLALLFFLRQRVAGGCSEVRMSVELGTARAAPGLRLGRLTWTPLGTGGGGHGSRQEPCVSPEPPLPCFTKPLSNCDW